jgi:hypothetical protein
VKKREGIKNREMRRKIREWEKGVKRRMIRGGKRGRQKNLISRMMELQCEIFEILM